MSTQRRQNLWQRTSCMELRQGSGQFWLSLLVQFVRAIARVGTAPQQASLRLPAQKWATNSLHPDRLFAQLVRFVEQDIRRGSPPSGTASPSAGFRSSLPLTPTPSVLDRLHSALPHRGSPIALTRNHLA